MNSKWTSNDSEPVNEFSGPRNSLSTEDESSDELDPDEN